MLPFSIAFENDDLFIIVKPAGIPSASIRTKTRANNTFCAVDWALEYCPTLKDLEKQEYGLLHRLDTGTSGLLAFAKSKEAYLFYVSAWGRGQAKTTSPFVSKSYRAIVSLKSIKTLIPKPQMISHPIGHSPKSKRKMIVVKPEHRIKPRGKSLQAVTNILAVHSLNTLKLQSIDPKLNAAFELEIEIKTGVMHQIRCHLASIGFPVVGDVTYGSPVQLTHFFLHAWKLKLPNRLEPPKWIHVTADRPKYWP